MSDAVTPVRPPAWGLGWVAGAFVVAVVGSSFAVSLAVGTGAANKSIGVTVAGLLGEWVGFIGVPVLFTITRGAHSLVRDFGLQLAGWRDVALGLAAGLGTYVLVLEVAYPPFLWLLELLVGHHVRVGNAARQLGSQGRGVGFVVFALSVAVGAPLAEELFFRGLLMRALGRSIPGAWAVLVSALLFGLAHLGSTEAAALPALVVFGVVLGVLYDRTGRLGPAVVAHIAFNGVTVIALAASR